MKYLLLTALLFTTPLMAKPYNVNMDKSQVTFTAVHAGNEFQGEFHEWNADIDFDADNLNQSSVTVTFNTASTKTGDMMYDGTLPTKNWFDVDGFPTATFKSTSFDKTDDGFTANGDLIIKGIPHPLSFDFTLKGDNPVHMRASFPVDRLIYNIGKEADPTGEWVSKDIQMNIHLEASPID